MTATHLHEMLAISKTVKSTQNRVVTDFYHVMQKPALFNGMTRVYQPKDDDGEQLPPESVLVQRTVPAALAQVQDALSRLMAVQAEIDVTNMEAVAAVIIGETHLTPYLPATHLLWLEKQITDLRTVIQAVPTLDPAQVWSWDSQQGLWATDELKTNRPRKVYRNHVKAPATDKHPAQVEVYTEDVTVGTWVTRKLSGAMPATEVEKLLGRVDTVLKAVKQARERANSTETRKATSAGVLDYIFSS